MRGADSILQTASIAGWASAAVTAADQIIFSPSRQGGGGRGDDRGDCGATAGGGAALTPPANGEPPAQRVLRGMSAFRRGSRRYRPSQTRSPITIWATKGSPTRQCVQIAPPMYPARRTAPRTDVAGIREIATH